MQHKCNVNGEVSSFLQLQRKLSHSACGFWLWLKLESQNQDIFSKLKLLFSVFERILFPLQDANWDYTVSLTAFHYVCGLPEPHLQSMIFKKTTTFLIISILKAKVEKQARNMIRHWSLQRNYFSLAPFYRLVRGQGQLQSCTTGGGKCSDPSQ